MINIPVTQYLRPNGRTEEGHIEVNEDIGQVAIDTGLIVSAEVLPTSDVAFYCRYPDQEVEEEQLTIAANGPGIVTALEQLIQQVLASRKEAE